jgi:hypothetical protein
MSCPFPRLLAIARARDTSSGLENVTLDNLLDLRLLGRLHNILTSDSFVTDKITATLPCGNDDNV